MVTAGQVQLNVPAPVVPSTLVAMSARWTKCWLSPADWGEEVIQDTDGNHERVRLWGAQTVQECRAPDFGTSGTHRS